MNYHGLTKKFQINRPLDEFEIQHQLRVNESSFDKPWGSSYVIKMNSTYLECVDKFFLDKGIISGGGVVLVAILIIFYLGTLSIIADRWQGVMRSKEDLYFMIYLTLLWGGAVIYICFFLRNEMFRYTHYPIRFNRKNRMVYVTRLDGTVMAESWDKLFFTEGECGGKFAGFGETRDIRGHRLAEDGKTVLETFALPHYSDVRAYHRFAVWEFIRRYMEEGPEQLMRRVPMVNDVADRRERFWAGFMHHYEFIQVHSGEFFALLSSPVLLLHAVGRWLAILTSKIPVWSAEVEAACQIDPNDPYVIDRDHPPKETDRLGNERLMTDTQKTDAQKAAEHQERAQAILKANDEYQRRRREEEDGLRK
ncbi:MAG: hypothetical protein LBE22_06460 [Azoarcus sp.]|jgi:hypothetical protein|nr:hypothetical protein [Azoarcus sp.]